MTGVAATMKAGSERGMGETVVEDFCFPFPKKSREKSRDNKIVINMGKEKSRISYPRFQLACQTQE